MSHEHIYTVFVKTLPDGRDVIRCACGETRTVTLSRQKPVEPSKAA